MMSRRPSIGVCLGIAAFSIVACGSEPPATLPGVFPAPSGAGGSAASAPGAPSPDPSGPAEVPCSGSECECPGGVCAGPLELESCGVGLTRCGNACVDVGSDALNCGACGRACGAGACNAGACPAGKDCAVRTTLTTPTLGDFETYVAGTPVEAFGFSFNAPPGSPLTVYSGPYQYDDGTGDQTLAMVPGNGSNFAASIQSSGASAWGGALGFWMSCIDASSFDGLAFTVRGAVPGGLVTLTALMESTSAPSATDPAAGGTCLSGCAPSSAAFPVTTEYQRVLLPWSAFGPGSANGAAVAMTGQGITGLTFAIALEWGELAGDPGNYGPIASAYELAVDDIGFFRTAEQCAPGEQVCDSNCVDPASDELHCGACDVACGGGSSCAGAQGCVCPDGLAFCAGACVDLDSDASHCGACGNFCAIGATCSAGACAGSPAVSSNRCGRATRLLGNPLGCSFGWGANPDADIPGFVDFASRWVGYEPNIATRCDGCEWLRSFANGAAVPVYIAYFAAYRANIEAGLGDCNLDFDGNNLCNGGAQWIRDNRARLLDVYADYAARSYAVTSDRPVVWIIEPDFSQYAAASQSNPFTMPELGQLASDIMCAIKSNMPNAVLALNHSTWLAGAELRSFWSAMPLDLIDLVHVTSSADIPDGYFNAGDANGREDGTFRFLNQLTGKPILADTSFGVTTMQDSWSTASPQTLNARIADGVAGVLIYPTPGNYAQRITTLGPQLASTCQ
ncbi:MAG: hypothetical protein ABW217_13000 [Polyangiaceae bacterium]